MLDQYLHADTDQDEPAQELGAAARDPADDRTELSADDSQGEACRPDDGRRE